jgi:hypothetical protein
VESGQFRCQDDAMAIVGSMLIAFLPTHEFQEILSRFDDPDEYSVVYEVEGWGPRRKSETKPTRDELAEAHWKMFLAILQGDDELSDLRQTAIEMGFEGCWQIHTVDLESGADAVADAQALIGS